MTHMQIAVRFRRKTRYHVAIIFAAGDIFTYELPNEIFWLRVTH
jgi:hypothetical protein